MPNAETGNWGGGISFLSEATQHSLLYARLAASLPAGSSRTLLENLSDAICDGLEAAQAQAPEPLQETVPTEPPAGQVLHL